MAVEVFKVIKAHCNIILQMGNSLSMSVACAVADNFECDSVCSINLFLLSLAECRRHYSRNWTALLLFKQNIICCYKQSPTLPCI